jgi:molybdopterin-guanine dinucleotide biosynthesis protein A
VVDDPLDGKGPVQGIAAGLGALRGRADVAFVCSADMPFLHPAFVRRVLNVISDSEGTGVALPVARGFKQPLAAAYRVGLADAAERLVVQDRLRPAFLFDECLVEQVDDEALRQDPVLAALDPDLDSVVNVNTPADYQAARGRPAPEVTVQLFGTLAASGGKSGPDVVRAANLGTAADAVGLVLDRHVTAELNGDQIVRDRETPLVTGDSVVFLPADAGG